MMLRSVSAESGVVTMVEVEDDPLTEADYARAVQGHIEAAAVSRRYDSAASCASYIASTNAAWAAEAAAFIAWRDAVWTQVYAAQAAHDPEAPPPTIAAVIAALPEIVWP